MTGKKEFTKSSGGNSNWDGLMCSLGGGLNGVKSWGGSSRSEGATFSMDA